MMMAELPCSMNSLSDEQRYEDAVRRDAIELEGEMLLTAELSGMSAADAAKFAMQLVGSASGETPGKTNAQLNRWAAELVGWKEAWRGLWFWPGTSSREQHEPIEPPDPVYDLGACPPLFQMLGTQARFWWDEEEETWICDVDGMPHKPYGIFYSPESEPGRCIVEAAMYVFGKKSDE